MELKHIITFVTVAETQSMTVAATRCNISQSAATKHIKMLEDELGVQLFERTKKDIQITEVGRIFLKRARNIIKESKECKEDIASYQGHLCGELRIGVGSFTEPYIRRAAIEFMRKYPDVLLHVQFDHASVLNKMLREGDIDIAFTMNTAYHYEGIKSMAAIPFHLSAVMSKRNSLAEKDIVTFDDLMHSRIIMPDVGERVFQSIQKYTHNDISKLPVTAIVSNPSAVMMVLDELDAITFLPSDYTISSHKLIAKPIESLDMELMSNAHWLKDKPMKASAREFINIVNKLCNNEV